MTRFLVMAVLICVCAAPAFAKDKKASEPAVVPAEKQKEKVRSHYEDLRALMEGRSKVEQRHFFTIYHTYNIIGTVEMVRDDVEKAVDACGDKNKEMKEKLKDRFKLWEDAVEPALDEAEAHVENMIDVQDYVDGDDIEDLLDEMDETREKTAKAIEKVPVTTPEACEFLHDKMDETQEKMVGLLRQLLVSVPLPEPEPEEEPEPQGKAAAE